MEWIMIILGIDPGYGRCGWAVVKQTNNEKLKTQNSRLSPACRPASPNRGERGRSSNLILIACDCIETDKNKNLPDRLKEIYDAIVYIIEKYNPQILAIEELFFFKNHKTVMAVSQARGVIIVAAKNKGIETFEYTPLQIKSAVVGYGQASKNQIQKMIKLHLWNQQMPVQDDAADAVAVALTHLQTKHY